MQLFLNAEKIEQFNCKFIRGEKEFFKIIYYDEYLFRDV